MNSGNPNHLSTVESAVMDHVQRFRCTISELVHHAVQQPSAEVRNAITAMERARLVVREPLTSGASFLAVCGRRRSAGIPTGRNRIKSLAALYFCHFRTVRRELLTAQDFKTHFPDLYRPQNDRRYCLEHGCEASRLVYLRVDHGGHGRWSRIIDKAQRDFDKHRNDPAFSPLIPRRWFEVHILTATSRKAIRIKQAIDRTRRRADESIGVTAIPELLPLMLTHRNSSRL